MDSITDVLFIIASLVGAVASVIVIIDKVRLWFLPPPETDGMLLVETVTKTKKGKKRFVYTKKEATRMALSELSEIRKENELLKKSAKLTFKQRLVFFFNALIFVFVTLLILFFIRKQKNERSDKS